MQAGTVPAGPDEGTKQLATAGDRVTDPLAAARARGRRWAFEEYENPDNLALPGAQYYAASNEGTINGRLQRGELYALLPPGRAGEFRFPKW